ncbi:MAG: MBL fold metallo-hydrolase [Clostridiales bacterium]|nr:MBL fold metallo-hydrolase [Clostridiales bacterium]
MHIKFLGTAAAEGIPAPFCSCPTCENARENGGRNIRTRSQCLVNDDLLLDFSPDTYMHTLTGGLDLRRVKYLFITHSHSDHLYENDLLLRTFPYGDAEDTLEIFASQTVCNIINSALRASGASAEGKKIHLNPVSPFETVSVGKYRVSALEALHSAPKPCLLYSIEDAEKRFLYAHDTGFFPEKTMQFISSMRYDCISLDCTCGHTHSDGKRHMGLADADEMRRRLFANGNISPRTKVIVNHFSHNGIASYDEIKNRASRKGFEVSHDGLEIEI